MSVFIGGAVGGRELAPSGGGLNVSYGTGAHTYAIGALYFLFVSLLFGAVTLYLYREYLGFFPYPAMLFAEGIIMGLIHASTNGGFNDLSYSIELWTSIDPYLLSAVFLPALIFSDAMKVDIHLFRRIFSQAALMATAGVALQTAGMALVARYFLFQNGYQWDWQFCFTFGAVLSATDPIAVVAMLEAVQAPAKLTTLMSGESHLSDLLALMTFNLMLTLSKDLQSYSTDKIVRYVMSMLFGGPALGLAFGIIALVAIRMNTAKDRESDVMIQVTITIVLAYLSFIVSENNASGNGVLATVTAALVIAAYAWPSFASPDTIRSVWKAIEFTGSTIIFMLAGLVIGTTMYEYQGSYITKEIYGIALFMWLIAYGIRAGIVILFFPILRKLGYGLKLSEAVIMTWGGLRGAVAVTLGLIVFNSYPELQNSSNPVIDSKRDTVQFFFLVGAVVFLSILVNSSTTPLLMKALRILSKSGVQKMLLRGINSRIRAHANKAFKDISSKSEYSTVNVPALKAIISSLDDEKITKEWRERFACYNKLATFFRRSKKSSDVQIVNIDGHDCNQELLEVVRELFYDIVKASYWDMIESGILPRNSAATRTLLQSVDIAKDTTDSPLSDFSYMALPITREQDEQAYHERLFERIDKCLPEWVTIDDYFGEKFHAMVRENAIFMASSYIHAHTEAQSKVAQYVGEGDDADSPEEHVVIEESKKLVKMAQDFMDICKQRDPEVVDLVTTKKVGSHVLRAEDDLIDELNKQGVLDEVTEKELHDIVNDEYVALLNMNLHAFRKAAHKSKTLNDGQVAPAANDQA